MAETTGAVKCLTNDLSSETKPQLLMMMMITMMMMGMGMVGRFTMRLCTDLFFA